MTWLLGMVRLVPAWVWVAMALGAALLWQHERIGYWQGQTEQRDTQIARMKADTATDMAAASETARLKDRAATLDTERIANATDQQIIASAARAAAADRAARGLRGEIDRLNGRPDPVANPGAATFAGEARVARELLGACAAEYTGLAADADGLRIQVMGLQEFALGPAGAGK